MTRINENAYIGESGYKLKDIITHEYCVATTTYAQTISSNYFVNLNQFDRKKGNFTLSNGGIKIGAGIHHIRVSGAVFIDGWPASSYYLWTRIFKNNTCVSSMINGGTSSYLTGSVPNTIIEVQENDVIKIMADCGGGGSIRAYGDNTWLCIEKID